MPNNTNIPNHDLVKFIFHLYSFLMLFLTFKLRDFTESMYQLTISSRASSKPSSQRGLASILLQYTSNNNKSLRRQHKRFSICPKFMGLGQWVWASFSLFNIYINIWWLVQNNAFLVRHIFIHANLSKINLYRFRHIVSPSKTCTDV